jgi:hypothetical protein
MVRQQLPRGPTKTHVIIGAPAKHVLEGSNAVMAVELAQRHAASVLAKAVNVSIRPPRYVDITCMARAR